MWVLIIVLFTQVGVVQEIKATNLSLEQCQKQVLEYRSTGADAYCTPSTK